MILYLLQGSDLSSCAPILKFYVPDKLLLMWFSKQIESCLILNKEESKYVAEYEVLQRIACFLRTGYIMSYHFLYFKLPLKYRQKYLNKDIISVNTVNLFSRQTLSLNMPLCDLVHRYLMNILFSS